MGYRRALALLLSLALVACATPAPAPVAAGPTFVVVRHAEKADDGTRDPPLTVAGAARAQRLALALRDEPVVAVYATAYQRTRQTAAATAAGHRLLVSTYAAAQPATELAAHLRRQHRSGTVLVVGHSNTVPGIAAALCGCAATPLADDDYGRAYRIDIAADGQAVLRESALP